jgi:thiosulfate/3-mercaptopyruvate sulfurtransferase
MIEDLPDSPLVRAAWLLKHREQPDLRVVDARFLLGRPDAGAELYRAGHIPKAVFVDLERDLSDPVRPDRVGGRHPLPAPEVLAARLGALGIGDDQVVIAYDDPSSGQGFYAAHLWWVLRYLGHDAVRVLDGGVNAWTAAGGALEAGTVALTPAVFSPHPRATMLVNADEVARRSEQTVLIDSRAPERYRGELEPLDWKSGHIPGAVNLNWAGGVLDGRWLEGAAQRDFSASVSRK